MKLQSINCIEDWIIIQIFFSDISPIGQKQSCEIQQRQMQSCQVQYV